ncbi:MAG: hypothetical protein WBA57_03480 [Elainellaceae cyanobacterium]
MAVGLAYRHDFFEGFGRPLLWMLVYSEDCAKLAKLNVDVSVGSSISDRTRSVHHRVTGDRT